MQKVKLVKCDTIETIDEGLERLVAEFKDEYSYYQEWCKQKRSEILSGKRKIYALITPDNEKVGYIMLNYYYQYNSVKLNAIFIDKKYRGNGYASLAFFEIFKMLKDYDYLFVQTRTYNNIVLHMFDRFEFYIIGMKRHKIEKMNNVIAVYDIKRERNFSQMIEYAESIYEDFTSI